MLLDGIPIKVRKWHLTHSEAVETAGFLGAWRTEKMAAPEEEAPVKDNSACLEASTETVIITAARRGDGSKEAPYREVRQYWSMQGDILAELDPMHDPSDGHPAEVPAGPQHIDTRGFGEPIPPMDTDKLESLWSVARIGMIMLESWVAGNGTPGKLLGDYIDELAKIGLRPQFPETGPAAPTYRMDNYMNLHAVTRAAHRVFDYTWPDTKRGELPGNAAPDWIVLRDALKQAGFIL